MKDQILYVLENYPKADLSILSDRELVAESIINYFKVKDIVMYTSLPDDYHEKNIKLMKKMRNK